MTTTNPTKLATFDRVPLSKIIERVDEGNNCLSELVNVFKSKLDLEEKNFACSNRISRMNIYETEIHGSSSERALGLMKNFFIYLSQDQAKYSRHLSEDILKRLESVKTHRTLEVTRMKSHVTSSMKEVSLAVDALDRAKKAFTKAKMDVHLATSKLFALEQALLDYERGLEERRKERERDALHGSGNKFSMGRMLSSAFEFTPEQDRDKQQRKLMKKKSNLLEAGVEIATRKKALMMRLQERDAAIQMVHMHVCVCIFVFVCGVC